MPLTPAQNEAVQARGNVIVVAGAGTGKTSTLVERCVALLAEGCSIERILMVTFTEAAAAEMRHRLQLKVGERAAEASLAPERILWWQEQQALLDTARICTLHGFCLQLVRENFHLLGIDPAVKVLDEQQTRPLIETSLDEALEPHLSGADADSGAVQELIRRLAQGDVERIRALVLKVHRHAQSLPAPDQWFDAQQASLEPADPVAWRHWLMTEAGGWSQGWLADVEAGAGQAANLARCANALRTLISGFTPEQLRQVLAEILAADADWPGKMKGKLRKPYDVFFAEAGFLASQFEPVGTGDCLQADWENVRHGLRALLELTRDFSRRFAAAKRELGGIDFSDLEQFALLLLRDAEGGPSAVAAQWQKNLDHVFVDECQDINAAQDAILTAVSRGGSAARPDIQPNRFLVGDVKQSIYQFRLARPALFRGYERQWTEGQTGRRILLAENFRSEPGIIHFVNALFAPLMRDDVGGVEYEPLIAGRTGSETGMPGLESKRVEFHLIPKSVTDVDSEDGEFSSELPADDLLAAEKEARLVALRLSEMRTLGVAVWDKTLGASRPVEWRDMAVLLRSPGSRVEAFAQEFHKCGVPLQAARGGFLESTEIVDLLSLLRLLDNPLQDIPLLAVLRSPLVALTLDELAVVRICSGERRFWTALRVFHRETKRELGKPDCTQACSTTARSAFEKVDWFLQRFAVWRELVRQVSLSHGLETALKDAHYEAVVLAGERGAERVANIRKFAGTVRQYDPYQRQGLFRFLKYVDALEAAEQDMEPAPAQTQDAVRLMSIHKSKGLEFPVVVVACLGGMFNLSDLQRDVLLDEDFGLCARAVSPLAGSRHPTLAHWLAARRQRRQVLGEELRLLYVAATRARDRLILTATANRKDCEAWEAAPERRFGSREILAARSPLDWLLLWLPGATRCGDWFDVTEGETILSGGAGELLRWKVWTQSNDFRVAVREPELVLSEGEGDAEETDCEPVRAVTGRVRWRYGHVAASDEPAKTSVTVLRRKAAAQLDEDVAVWKRAAPAGAGTESSNGDPGAAEIGTLHHQFLQRMSIAGACDEADLRDQLSGLVERGEMTATQAAVLDLAAMVSFWQGEPGAEIRANAAFVRREMPFTARFSPVELEQLTGAPMHPELGDEFVVVQGVADLVVIKPTELWLLDFKTDSLKPQDLDAKVAHYRPQLELYATALSAIHRLPVTRRWLHFLKPGKTVPV